METLTSMLLWTHLHTMLSSTLHPKKMPKIHSQYYLITGLLNFCIPNILVTDSGKEYINAEFTQFCRTYVQFKLRTPYALWSNRLVENSNRQLNTFLRTVLDSQYDTWSHKVKVVPFAFNSQVRNNMKLSLYELVFGQKPKKSIMFNLSSTTDSLGNCKTTENSPCKSLPNHTPTDHLGHHPQIIKLQKRTFAHWFLNREKIHSEVYKEVNIYLNQNKHLRTFIKRRSNGAATQNKCLCFSCKQNQTNWSIKKIQPQKIGPYQITDTPTLVTYKLEDFSGKQITRHRSNMVHITPKNFLFKNKWRNISRIIPF